MKLRPRVYFAHALSDYHTAFEARVLAFLKFQRKKGLLQGLSIENPNQPRHQRGYTAAGNDFKYFTDLVEICKGGVVFLRMLSGGLGAGVGKEVHHALAIDRDVWEVVASNTAHGLYIRMILDPEAVEQPMSIADTRAELDRNYLRRNGGRP